MSVLPDEHPEDLLAEGLYAFDALRSLVHCYRETGMNEVSAVDLAYLLDLIAGRFKAAQHGFDALHRPPESWNRLEGGSRSGRAEPDRRSGRLSGRHAGMAGEREGADLMTDHDLRTARIWMRIALAISTLGALVALATTVVLIARLIGA